MEFLVVSGRCHLTTGTIASLTLLRAAHGLLIMHVNDCASWWSDLGERL